MKKKLCLAIILIICITTVVSSAMAYTYTYTMTPYRFKQQVYVGSSFIPDSSGRIRININAKTYDTSTSTIPQTDTPQTFKVVPMNSSNIAVNYYSLGYATSWSNTVTMQGFSIGNAYTILLKNYTQTQYIGGTGSVNYG